MFSMQHLVARSQLHGGYVHLHHCDIIRLLELARLEMLREKGLDNDELVKQGFLIVLTDIQVSFEREVREGMFTITCGDFVSLRRKLSLEQQIVNDQGRVCVSALVTLMFMSGETRRAIRPPELFYQRFNIPSSPLKGS